MCRNRRLGKFVSFILLAFGIGILFTFLLSLRVLVVFEAILLITAGILFLLNK